MLEFTEKPGMTRIENNSQRRRRSLGFFINSSFLWPQHSSDRNEPTCSGVGSIENKEVCPENGGFLYNA